VSICNRRNSWQLSHPIQGYVDRRTCCSHDFSNIQLGKPD
jgi:hypothetical protein